jgi:site-specific recombinase XerD
MSAEEYHKAADLPSVRGQTLPKGRAVKNSELELLIELCQADKSLAGPRDTAMLAVLYSTGLRRAELVKLDLTDYNREEASILVRGGKGGKDRRCFLSDDATPALDDWLIERGEEAGPLFCPVTKAGKIRMEQANHLKLKRLTTQAVLYILQKRVGEAGGKVASLSPHDLRRSFITDLLAGGNDLATVQKMAGHANVTTTARYDRRGEEAQRKAARTLKVPYKPGKDKTKLQPES